MPTTITVTAYTFDELSDKAKDKARETFRHVNVGHDWWDFIFEDADTVAALLGIDIDRHKGEPDIRFSGFGSQGDGASFTGTWTPKDAVKAAKAHAPADTDLHAIAAELQAVGLAPNVRAVITRPHGHYVHEHTVTVDLEDMDETTDTEPRYTVEQKRAAAEALRGFMRWIYRQLSDAYYELTDDPAVDETIRANEYLFTKDGKRTHTL